MSSEDTFRELDGASVLYGDVVWRLSVWGIHQIGTELWVQMSVAAGAAHHDLVLHMAHGARGRDAVASIEAWLESPFPASQILHVS